MTNQDKPGKMLIKMPIPFCNDLLIHEKTQPGSQEDIFHIKREFEYYKGKTLWKIIPTITLLLTKKDTGEIGEITCSTKFYVETDWDFKKNITNEISLNIFTEMTLVTEAHLRAYLLEKSKNTVFEGSLLRYTCFNELKIIVTRLLLGMLN